MEDSRLTRSSVTHPTLPLERVYCVSCGRPKGWVSTDSASYIKIHNVIVICDRCEELNGKPPLVEAPIKEIK